MKGKGMNENESNGWKMKNALKRLVDKFMRVMT